MSSARSLSTILFALSCLHVRAQSTAPPANATVSPASNNLPIIGSNTTTLGTISTTASTAATSTTTSTAAIVTANPLIPSSISPACQSFLEYLNADPTISACTAPLVSALSLFNPSTVEGTNFKASEAQINSSMAALCVASACSSSVVRTELSHFNGNCSAELIAENPVVLGSYDVLYVLVPMTQAVCSTDATGGFCLTDITAGAVPSAPVASTSQANSSMGNNTVAGSATLPIANASAPLPAVNATGKVLVAAPGFRIQDYAGNALNPQTLYITVASAAQQLLRRRQLPASSSSTLASTSSPVVSASTTVAQLPVNSTVVSVGLNGGTGLLPNATTFRNNSVPFLFLSPDMSSSVLCTSCTKAILASYISWESRIPYALGLANSPLLGGQGKLWTGIGGVCGSGFLQSTAVQAGQNDIVSGVLSHFSLIIATSAVGIAAMVSLIVTCLM